MNYTGYNKNMGKAKNNFHFYAKEAVMFSEMLVGVEADYAEYLNALELIQNEFQSADIAGVEFQPHVLFLRDREGDLFTVTEAELDVNGDIHVLGRKNSPENPLQWDVTTGGYLGSECLPA